MSSTTSIKAFAFGIGATLAITLGVFQAEAREERAQSIVTLEPVVIHAKRVKPQQLPTVYITGQRDRSADGAQLAAAPRVSCATSTLC